MARVGFPGGSVSKESPAVRKTQVRSLGWEDPPGGWGAGGTGQPIPGSLPGESPWTEETGGYSPWGCKSRTGLSDFHFHSYFL